jgi:DinB superfamily
MIATLPEITTKLAEAFAETERVAHTFSEEQFFKRPATGKWSAAENVQHLFLSVKPLVGLFGKPEMMLQFGKRNRAPMDYGQVVALYHQMLASPAAVPVVSRNSVDRLSATQAEQIANLKSIHAKFIERAATLPDDVLDNYQIPHPLMGLLTVREFLLFTIYHEGHHRRTMEGMRDEGG